MKIKEVSDRTGLSRKTIRFYEERGLFSPKKEYVNGKEFRDYAEEDVARLDQIATLRRARFTVDEIRRMKEAPEETGAIFQAYHQRIRQEKDELETILQAADRIAESEFHSAEDLAGRLADATAALPLPRADIHPRFRYLDELEERLASRKKKPSMTEEELRQHKLAAVSAVNYAAFSVQNNPGNNMAAGGKSGGFDISNAQKIAAYNLLMNDKDE